MAVRNERRFCFFRQHVNIARIGSREVHDSCILKSGTAVYLLVSLCRTIHNSWSAFCAHRNLDVDMKTEFMSCAKHAEPSVNSGMYSPLYVVRVVLS